MTTWRAHARSITNAFIAMPLIAVLGVILEHARRW